MPLQTFVDFAKGSNVVLHESVGPVFNFSAANLQSRNIILNHTTQAQVGAVFNALKVTSEADCTFLECAATRNMCGSPAEEHFCQCHTDISTLTGWSFKP